mmetsp:Transcript_5614/g.14021  ORF Transcript_5614/g.14021 Transcript_5614/m.14021 type:complete len:1287 (-) Transcript_5614:183-4043(-)|eukprot:CAMPEP_0181137526 /NCGR_PEP_ID=MMETSP1071-20121207/33752_1 /TAXON_ID=35127 /ORGANISM="Thalassiosira sp., Strain NH16" /LENGTH=1286 /DNA_ID=CAMNT_0023224285 /DNA_START=10 /DNA_END=3870 /DNA_ORIENTATION=+
MHIKSITLSNFRSFKQQPEIHPFSAEMNCVVGRNGSGKSNLFDAVQFVLGCPKFWSLRTEERQSLLHEGSGSAAVNAFVEIVFDNSDNRFSLENSDEVVLRRTIGHKKDEFFLQRKRATKNEIMSLLEGAGFSKSNPYFIVQQGKVNALCTMSDGERLQLLKEVAGTTVYDEKKEESLAKMDENRASVEKINETLEYMENKLDELKDEKDELDAYQKLDRDRRAVEYTLYDKELRRAREGLDEIEHARNEEVDRLSALHEEVRDMHERILSVQADEKTKKNALKRNAVYVKSLEKDKTAAMTHKTKLDLERRELEEQLAQGNEALKSNKRELAKLNEEIAEAEKNLLEEIQPAYDDARETMTRMSNEREEARKRMEGLYAKQGRGKQFRTKKERDDHLHSQIRELTGARDEKEEMLHETRTKLGGLRKSLASEGKEVESKKIELQEKGKLLEGLTRSIDEKKRVRNEMADSRKEQWRSINEISDKVGDAKEASRKALYDMRKSMPRATSLGLDALKQIVVSERLTVGVQYFGLVMENFDLTDDKYSTAVEVAAQNALFHIIVDTDATAARLMKRLEDERLGRVTFLPLNQLKVDSVRYPESTDVAPLMEQCISFDPAVRRAMEHVFARKLLARSVDVASTWSTRSGMDAITLDGDLCSRKGALTGGFVDAEKSRLRAHYTLKRAEEALRKLEGEHREMKEKSTAVDQQVSNVMGEVQRLEAKHANLDHMMGRIEDDVKKLARARERNDKQAMQIEEDIPPMETQITSLASQIERLDEELGTELTSTLTKEERELLDELKASQTRLDGEIEEHTGVLEEATIKRQRLTSHLEDNLIVRRNELTESSNSRSARRKSGAANATGASQARIKEELEQRRRELEEATTTAEEVDGQLGEVKAIDENLRGEIVSIKNNFDKLKTQDAAYQKELEESHESQEKLLNKRSMCIQKREDYMRKIQELGSLPPAAELTAFTKKSIPSLMKKLEEINKKLRKYSHVNKKAFDQFVNFSEQRTQLIQRREEIDEGGSKVKELIDSLDRKKDEAINRTFRGVSAHFKDVFKELVPLGSGELIMRTAMDEAAAEGTDSESEEGGASKKKAVDDPNNPDVSLFRGVSVKVRFSRSSENFLMSQLSGGQKALVAMALIFAIQRCDPAPFYLFDELDQALDSTYRAAVAGLIKRQATPSADDSDEEPRESTQFICSTFRPELVAAANRCFGISHQNKVSSFHLLSKNDALHFIANLMSEEEAVGEVTSMATSNRATAAGSSRGSGNTTSKKRKVTKKSSEDEE